MPSLLIRHAVADYAIWKPLFDAHEAARRGNGCQGSRLFRSADDPHEVLILLDWDDLLRARLFVDSDELRVAMQRAGVTDEPDIWFLEDGDRLAV